MSDANWKDGLDLLLARTAETLLQFRDGTRTDDLPTQRKLYEGVLKAFEQFVVHCEANQELRGVQVGDLFLFEGQHYTVVQLGPPTPDRSVTILPSAWNDHTGRTCLGLARFLQEAEKIPMSQDYFIQMCWDVVQARGQRDRNAVLQAQIGWGIDPTESLWYEDNIIQIVAEGDSQRILVIKKDNNNPIVCTDEQGKVLRWHGEAALIRRHLQGLAVSVSDPT